MLSTTATVFGRGSAEPRPAVLAAGPLGAPLGGDRVELTAGLLGDWQRRNARRTLPHVVDRLHEAGNLDNFRRVAGATGTPFRGRYPFLDTDVYKTLEAVAYELSRREDPDVRAWYEEAVGLVAAAQGPDGYLSTYHQGPQAPGSPWADLAGGHELYNLGHLVQAAVAASRRLADDRLLAVARRFADLVVRRFGDDGRAEYCGHPEVETALVELARETGHEPYLRQAELFVERRGSGLFADAPFGPAYYQDRRLRDLDTVTGHAVRMVYLAAGATDVAVERGDDAMLERLQRLWDDMVAAKSYVTGGIGSRHSDEAFGDRYELPSERAYAETCAAVGAMQWGWRLFVATGRADVLDHVETVLYNGFAAGVSADGTRFFYDNPLQRRPDHQDGRPTPAGEPLRRTWFGCPCCPPNALRWIAGLSDHVAVADEHSVTLALLTACRVRSATLELDVVTDYPWDARVAVRIIGAREGPATLAVRVPGWATAASATLNGATLPVAPDAGEEPGWLRLTREWHTGEELVLDLPLCPRLITSHPAVDATRGSVAAVRGPVVHCVEQMDCPVPVDELVLDQLPATEQANGAAPEDPLMRHALFARAHRRGAGEPVEVPLVPYHLWANRTPGAMRVWIPRT